MNLAQYLKLVQKPSLGDLNALAKIEKITLKWVSSSEIAEEFTVELFNLFHEAFQSSPHVFVTEIFFPNQLLLRKTYLNDEYILNEFKKALKISNLKRRQIKLVGIYRSLVSDLFDPYLTILIACSELKEGIFQSMKVSNLGYSEINKVQFLAKRLNNDLFFSGYSSIIRNAISHTGTHGVEYFENKILFRNIRRDRSSPKSQSLEFSTEELIELIQKLIDFIISTGTAINLMGLDLNDIIVKDMRFAQKFQMLVTPKQLANRRKSNDRAFGKIWNNDRLARIDKLDHFTRLFAVACKKNGMPAKSLRFSENFVIISIPHKMLKDNGNVTLINRALELAEYLRLAEMYFHFVFSDFLVEEQDPDKGKELQFWVNRDDLRLYNLKESHPMDIIHDGKLYRNNELIEMNVDFEELRRIQRESLDVFVEPLKIR